MTRVARCEEGAGLLSLLNLEMLQGVLPRRGRKEVELERAPQRPGVGGKMVFETCPGVEGRQTVRAKRRGGEL
eukprot:6320178-Prorocentrum_lima.AAC.1